MKKVEIVKKLKSLKLCLVAHPDNQPNSEFADRIEDLSLIISHLEVDVKMQRKGALEKVEKEYSDPESTHYRDNERYKWAVDTINEGLKI